MRHFTFAIVLFLALISVAGVTGRSALSQERVLAPAQLAGADVLLARSASGIEVWAFDGGEWQQLPNGPPWSDDGDWNRPEYYSTIQTGDVDGDGRAELLGRSASGIEVWAFDGSGWQQLPDGPAWSDAGGWNRPEYYSTIQTGDVDGDGRAELLARSASGVQVWEYEDGAWKQLPDGPAWSDAGGWNAPEYYGTIQTAGIPGSELGPEKLLARSASGIEAWEFDGSDWQRLLDGPPWGDVDGWNAPERYSTIQAGNIYPLTPNSDELLARGESNIELWRFGGTFWLKLQNGPPWSDAGGWSAPEYYSTIQTADIYGDGHVVLLARTASAIELWRMVIVGDDVHWQQLANGPAWSDAAGWNAPEYYSTIQSGDVDGDGREELLARGATGIDVWGFDGGAWQQLPSGPAWSDAAGWDRPEYYSTIQTANIEGLPPIYLPMIVKPQAVGS